MFYRRICFTFTLFSVHTSENCWSRERKDRLQCELKFCSHESLQGFLVLQNSLSIRYAEEHRKIPLEQNIPMNN